MFTDSDILPPSVFPSYRSYFWSSFQSDSNFTNSCELLENELDTREPKKKKKKGKGPRSVDLDARSASDFEFDAEGVKLNTREPKKKKAKEARSVEYSA